MRTLRQSVSWLAIAATAADEVEEESSVSMAAVVAITKRRLSFDRPQPAYTDAVGHDLYTGYSLSTVCGQYTGYNLDAGRHLTTLGLAFAKRCFERGDAGVPAQSFLLGRCLYALQRFSDWASYVIERVMEKDEDGTRRLCRRLYFAEDNSPQLIKDVRSNMERDVARLAAFV